MIFRAGGLLTFTRAILVFSILTISCSLGQNLQWQSFGPHRIAKLPPNEPFVLTGDFNTTPDSKVHAMLTQHLKDAWLAAPHQSGPDKTFHDFTGKPTERIDWILVRGFKVEDVRTVTTHEGQIYPSDHFPVMADLQWPKGDSPR